MAIEMSEVTLGIGKEKKTFTFIRDSFKLMQTGMLSDARFLQNIFYFSKCVDQRWGIYIIYIIYVIY